MKIIVLAVLLLLTGCSAPALESYATDNRDIVVDKLFTKDGCTVYRFIDGGERRYFARCEAAQSSVNWTENCGKGCQRDHLVASTVYKSRES